MGRSNDFEKWQLIYIDQKDGMTWNEIVAKNKTSRQTISKAIKFFKTLEIGNSSDTEALCKKYRLPKEKMIELQENIIQNHAKKLESEGKDMKNKQYQYLNKIQNIMKMLESMNNSTRIRLILILLIYNELSLTNLSKKLGVSKSTVLRHLKALISTNLIKVRKQQVNVSRKKHYYSIVPNLLQIIRLSSSELKSISPEKALAARILDLKNDRLTLRTIKNIMNEFLLYYKNLEEQIEQDPPINHREIEQTFSTENICRFYLWIFNKKQFEVFRAKYLAFLQDLLKEMEQYQNYKEEKQEINPYFVWHMIAPIKKIYDSVLNKQK